MNGDTTPGPGPRAGRREWLGLAVLALATLLLSVDTSVLILALPSLSADLGASTTQQLWIIDIYAFAVAGLLVTMGSLGDRIGRRRLLLIGGAAFGLASLLAAFSVSPEMLIAARALLGLAGATIMPSALALISGMFRDAKQRGTAIAVFMSCFMAGGTLGPVVGGALLTNYWWGSVFLVNVPIMVLLLAAGPVVLPEFRDPEGRRLDLTSVVLSLAAILPVIYALKQLPKEGLKPLPLIALAAGLFFAVVFTRRQRVSRDPLLDLRLFSRPSFSAAIVIMLLGSVMMSGIAFFFTLFMQLVRGLSPLQAGLCMVVSAVGMVIGSMAAPTIARQVRPGVVLAVGLLISAVGFVPLSQVGAGTALVVPLVAIGVVSLGAGGFASLGTGLVVGAVPPKKAGSAAALAETGGELGIALGIATLGTLGTGIYRSLLNVPAAVPADAAQSARENITGAAAAAHTLPGPAGAELLDNARLAFTTALNVVAGVAAVIAAALAVLAVTVLRKTPPTGVAESPVPAVDDAGAKTPNAA